MDSDAMIDSLSPADGIKSEPSGFGLGLASSFSTHEADPANTIDGSSRGTPQLDSCDLSSASDGALFLAPHGEFLGGMRNRASSQYGEALTPLSESLGMQSSSELLRELRVEDSARRHGGSNNKDDSGAHSTQTEVRNSRITPLGQGTTRKRPRKVVTEGRKGTVTARPHPQSYRLEKSWPLDRAAMHEGDGGEDQSWGGSAPLISPLPPDQQSTSGRRIAQVFREQGSESVGSRSIGPAIDESNEKAMASGRRWNRRDGTQGRNYSDDNHDASGVSSDTTSDVGGACSTEDASSRDEGSTRRNGNRWIGLGLRETLSVSDVSSTGVPPPPAIPSGPLPAIATVKEHFLTRSQREYVDHERRLAADRMRRLNQVLAGHLGFAEVAIQQVKTSSEKSSPAPSHGSAFGDLFHGGPSVDQQPFTTNLSNGLKDQIRRNSGMRRLIAQRSRECRKRALTEAWNRLCQHTSWEASRLASAVVPTAEATTNRNRTASFGRGEQRERGWEQNSRQQQQHIIRLVCRVRRERDKLLLFRAWSRLCFHTTSVNIARAAKIKNANGYLAGEYNKNRAVHSRPFSENANEAAESVLHRHQQQQHALRLISRTCRQRERRLIFRGWSRLCFHGVPRNAVEGVSASTTVAARGTRAQVVENETATAATSERALLEAAGTLTVASELRRRAVEAEGFLCEYRQRLLGILVVRWTSSQHRCRLFRGWSSLRFHAASLNAAEGVSPVATATARAVGADAMQRETTVAMEKMEALKNSAAAQEKAAAAVARTAEPRRWTKDTERDMVTQRSQCAARLIARVCGSIGKRLLVRGWSRIYLYSASVNVAERASEAAVTVRAERVTALQKNVNAAATAAHMTTMEGFHREKAGMAERDAQEQRKLCARRLIIRVCADRGKRALFRGWSRLCLHAASLSAAEGVAAAAAATSRAVRAEAMGREAAEAIAAADIASRERKRAELARKDVMNKWGNLAKRLIFRVCEDSYKRALSRGWTRLCLHAVSKRVSASATAAARVETLGDIDRYFTANSDAIVEAQQNRDGAKSTLEQRDRLRLKWLIARMCVEKERRMLYHAWSRLYAHAASLNAVERVSAAAAAAKDLEKDAATTVPIIKKLKKESAGEQMTHTRRRAKQVIIRVCAAKNKRFLFHAWSRLRFHVASFNIAEGTSAAATAVARAVRLDAVESDSQIAGAAAADTENQMARERSVREESNRRQAAQTISRFCGAHNIRLLFRGWNRLCLHAACVNSVERVARIEKAKFCKDPSLETDTTAATLGGGKRVADKVAPVEMAKVQEANGDLEEQRRRYACQLIVHVCSDRRKKGLFRGWSRLCLHIASINAAESASVAATAAERAAGDEAVQNGAAAVHKTAASEKRLTEAAAAAEEGALGENAVTTTVTAATAGRERGDGSKRSLQEQRYRCGCRLIAHVNRNREKSLLFRGWSRICLYASCLSVAEEVSAAATAAPRPDRAEALKRQASATLEAADKTESVTKLDMRLIEMEQQRRRAKRTITRACRDCDKHFLSRGWTRLCLYAASRNAAEARPFTITAIAGAVRAEAVGREPAAAAETTAAWRKATNAPAEAAAAMVANEQVFHGAADYSDTAAEKREQGDHAEQALHGPAERDAKLLITRICRDKERRLLYRSWSRLRLHAAALIAAEGVSSAVTGATRVASAEAMEKGEVTTTNIATFQQEAATSVAATAATVASTAREEALQDAPGASILAVGQAMESTESQRLTREQHKYRAMLQIAHIREAIDWRLLCRGWIRLCLHAASLNAAERSSGSVTTPARPARAEAMEQEAVAAEEKAEAWGKAAISSKNASAVSMIREEALQTASGVSTLEMELKDKVEEAERELREQQQQRALLSVAFLWRESQRRMLFRGWNRLCLQSASLSADEVASAATTAVARANRAAAMESEAAAADATAKAATATAAMVRAREESLRETCGVSAVLWKRVEASERTARKQERQAIVLITRIWREKDRRLLFRGWSRLHLHAASLNAVERTSAAATAAARAAKAEAMEKEVSVANKTVGAWRKAITANAAPAAAMSREKTPQEASGETMCMEELRGQAGELKRAVLEQKTHQALSLITQVWQHRERRLLFRGWNRLSLHAASLDVAEATSAVASASARAARAEAMETEAAAARDSATAVAAAKESAIQEMCDVSTLAKELRDRAGTSEKMGQEHQQHKAVLMLTCLWEKINSRLLFRSWSRLYLHAAYLNLAEGTSVAATAAARVARTEAIEKEASASNGKVQAWKRASAADATSAETNNANEEMLHEVSGVSRLAEELRHGAEKSGRVVQEQSKHLGLLLIIRVWENRQNRLLFRGWNRLSLHAASLNAAEGASAAATAAAKIARAEAINKEAAVALAVAEQAEGEELSRRKARAVHVLVRFNRQQNKQALWRAWHILCKTPAVSATTIVTSTNDAPLASPSSDHDGPKSCDEDRVDSNVYESTAAMSQSLSRTHELLKLVLHITRASDIRAVARGWAALKAAAAVSAVLDSSADERTKLSMMETYAVDLQLQAAARRRELAKKNRALAILLKDDWATTALVKDRETQAMRVKLAQVEADLEAQLDNMAGMALTTGIGPRSRTGQGTHWSGESGQRARGEENGEWRGKEEKETEGGPEVFLGGTEGGIGMIALQGEGARRLRSYVAGKGRDLNRARAETTQWRVRWEQLQHRLNHRGSSSPMANGPRAALDLLDLLDERDRRLVGLYKDFAALASGDNGLRTIAGETKNNRWRVKRQAADFLLQQMTLAAEEARRHIRRLIQRVQDLETTLAKRTVFIATNAEPARARTSARNARTTTPEDAATPEVLESTAALSITHDNTTDDTLIGKLRHTEDAVQVAIDAHELISALRSEVSALERHRHALEAKLDRFNLEKALVIDSVAAGAAWVASMKRTVDASPYMTHGGEASEGMGICGRRIVAPRDLKQLRARSERVERRAWAVNVLSQAARARARRASAMPEEERKGQAGEREELTSLAAAAERAKDVARHAAETFVSGGSVKVNV